MSAKTIDPPMQDVNKIFSGLEARLRGKAWFKKNGWLAGMHPFPRNSPEAITFHVYKKHWFNSDTRGIHFETFLYLDPKKRKKSSVHLHILHVDRVPGTKLKRKAVSKPFVDEIEDEVRSWDGYKFRVGKYGMQPFSKELNGASPGFAAEVEKELERLCTALGSAMDQVLDNLRG
jgi:hypothetical protein